jgi:hypothetical protein
LRKSLYEGQAIVESARNVAEKGKRAVVSFFFLSLAALFFFSGLIVAVLEVGLQIEGGMGMRYSGLMVSSTILFGLGLLLCAVGWILSRASSPPAAPQRQASSREERIKDLLEEFLVSFLSRLAKGSGETKKGEGPGPSRQD